MHEGKARFLPHNRVYHRDRWSVAIYARLSDEERSKKRKTDLSQSIQNQIEFLKNYVELQNGKPEEDHRLEIYRVYSDDDCTGMNFNRGGFQQMLSDIRDGWVDCIVVKNLSRLGRNDSEMQKYLKVEFEQNGSEVRVCAVGDTYDSLYKDPMDLEVRFKLMLNEQYSQTQHINVTIGMHTMQREGKYVAAFAPYGYRKDPAEKHRLLIDATAAVVVRRIYGEYLRGISPKEIARRLTEDGIVSPAAYKKQNGSNYRCGKKISEREVHWSNATVKKILQNEVYTGTVVQHKREKKKLLDKRPALLPEEEWIKVAGMHEPIIAKRDWETARGMMKIVKHDITREDEVTIFKGLLKCGDCGHAMRKRWDTYTTQEGEKHRYLYYNCGTYRDYGKKKADRKDMPGCSSHYISDKTIRRAILDDINTVISQIPDLQELIHRQREAGQSGSEPFQKAREDKKREVQRIRQRLKRAREKWLDEKLSDQEYEEVKTDYQQQIKALEAEAAELERQSSRGDEAQNTLWIRELSRLGRLTSLDRETVVSLVSQIEIYDTRTIKITYKFSDDFTYMSNPTSSNCI